MQINLAQAQIKTLLGNLDANLDVHMDYIEQAQEAQADILVFPELSLTGYLLQDLVYQVARKPTKDDPLFKPLYQASHDLDLLVSFVEADSRSRYFISAAYLSKGELLHVHRKVYLPTYGMFDDARYFAYGSNFSAFDTRFGRFGVLICEDFWHMSPPYLLWLDGAEVLLLPSASPGRGIQADTGKLATARWVEHVVQAYAALFTCYVSFTNRVGFEDGYAFWGGSTTYGPGGELLQQGPYLEPSLICTKLDLNEVRHARKSLPLLRDERPELTMKILNRILNDNSAEEYPYA